MSILIHWQHVFSILGRYDTSLAKALAATRNSEPRLRFNVRKAGVELSRDGFMRPSCYLCRWAGCIVKTS